MVEAMSHGCGGANCAHKAMQDWPALVSKRGVNAVVDEIAVAIGDKDAEDERGASGGDGLKLIDAALGIHKHLLMKLECLYDKSPVREHR